MNAKFLGEGLLVLICMIALASALDRDFTWPAASSRAAPAVAAPPAARQATPAATGGGTTTPTAVANPAANGK